VKLAVVGKENTGKTVLINRLMHRDCRHGCAPRALGESTWQRRYNRKEAGTCSLGLRSKHNIAHTVLKRYALAFQPTLVVHSDLSSGI
jgi:molybdopterin-guanine dinucleotide biosynthesis protein